MKIKIRRYITLCYLLIICLMTSLFTCKANSIEKTEIGKSLFTWEKKHGINEEVYFIYSDATKWNTMQDFYDEIEFKFHVPNSVHNINPEYNYTFHVTNFDCANDVLRNLRWIKKKNIAWVIKNLSNFNDFNDIYYLFSKYVLPFWEGKDDLNSVINSDSILPPRLRRHPKNFNVYYS